MLPVPAMDVGAPTNNFESLASSVIMPLLVSVVAVISAAPPFATISNVPELVMLVPARNAE
jgi:hypothetical protein